MSRPRTLYSPAAYNVLAAIASGNSVGIEVLGDSTSDEQIEFPYQLGKFLGQAFPAACVVYKIFDDTTQDYDGLVTIQPGAQGQRSIRFLGTAGGGQTRSLSAGSTGEIPDITGDLDLRLDLSFDSWTPAADTSMQSRWGSGTAKGYRFQLKSTSALQFLWTPDGTTTLTAISSASLPVTPGMRIQIRVTCAVASGTVTFYWRQVGLTAWTQLGTPQVKGAAVINNPVGRSYELGGDGGSTNIMLGNIFECEIRQGIAGKVINPQNVETWASADLACPLVGSPTVYIINGSVAGKNMAYFTDSTRCPLLLPDYRDGMLIVSDGHNEPAAQIDQTWTSTLDAALVIFKAQLPNSDIVFTTQNPETGANNNKQVNRMKATRAWAIRNGIDVFDTYMAFVYQPLMPLIIQTDGLYVHPNNIGRALENQVVIGAFQQILGAPQFPLNLP